ncbi:hypothetical protein [uncultured Methanobrevibacter sp.]|uniref:hypothetical protein n=1 Tax=uncultured Methanobrevibacter sp. TaxID=253161 RepID=UPI0025CF5D0A|nr:hypothetical protein [uncultured Methanobrevibacter sp.]
MFDFDELIEQIDLDENEKTSLKNNENLNESIVTGWKWIWKYDFEIDNFEAEEICRAINEIYTTKVSLDEVEATITIVKMEKKELSL